MKNKGLTIKQVSKTLKTYLKNITPYIFNLFYFPKYDALGMVISDVPASSKVALVWAGENPG